FAALEAQMANGGREALLYMLLNHDLAGRDIRQVPETEALAKQKTFSRRGVDRLIEIIAYEATIPCRHETYLNLALTSGEGEGNGFYAYARTIVPELKFVSSINIATALVDDWDCIRWKSGGRRGFRFPRLTELRARFNAKHGRQKWPDDADNDWQ